MTWFQLLLSSALLTISGSAPQDSLFNALAAPGIAVMFCVSSATLLPQTHETCRAAPALIPYKVPSSRSHKLVTIKIPGFRHYSLQLRF